MEPAIPFVIMVLLLAFFAATIPNYSDLASVIALLRQYAEFGFIAIAMTFVVMSGGIDLSVGSIFAICNFTALILLNIVGLSVPGVIAGTIAIGMVLGACNGYLVGFLKAKPFLTTLVTLTVFHALVEILNQKWSVQMATSAVQNNVWDYLGEGSIAGLPVNAISLLVVMLIGHLVLSRSRFGWHLTAIGSSRKAARHCGIKVEWVLFSTYVLSGLMCALAGVFYAARQNSAGTDTGNGWEVTALTAAVLGGVSLSGGRGSMGAALIGSVTVFAVVEGLVRLGAPGAVTSIGLGAILLLAVGLDVKWAKNRSKFIQKIYVNPTIVEFGPSPSVQRGSVSPYAENDVLLQAQAIGLGRIEGPEDVILDRQDRLYGSTREGWIVRFSGPNFEHRDVFARIGGRPLGMAFDKDENLIVCVGGMGLYGVRPDGEVFKLTDQTNRSWFKVNDDSRLRLADDLDIAPDGKIYFSEATIRYEMHSWYVDGVEGRGNGRLICYDPDTKTTRTVVKNMVFPNGVCITHDGQAVLVASTWLCKIFRYWIAGPRKGKVDIFADNLPGYIDNINRASDGGYWVALVGIRYPAYDLAMRKPGFRLKMIKQIPPDEWIYPGINNGCVIKFNAQGEAQYSFWDPGGTNHPTITSMREHKGWLYLGGLENNRIGRIPLDGANPQWTGWDSYWGHTLREKGGLT